MLSFQLVFGASSESTKTFLVENHASSSNEYSYILVLLYLVYDTTLKTLDICHL